MRARNCLRIIVCSLWFFHYLISIFIFLENVEAMDNRTLLTGLIVGVIIGVSIGFNFQLSGNSNLQDDIIQLTNKVLRARIV
jgi:hypothetical protein